MTQQRIRVIPYNKASKSAKSLAEALGAKRIKVDGGSFVPKVSDKIINWGYSQGWPIPMPRALGIITCENYNSPEDIAAASNKLEFFKLMKERLPNAIPKFWTNKDDIPLDCYPVVCRTLLNSHSGNGIVIAADPDGAVPCSLYVQYIKKQEEYRIHVGIKAGQAVMFSAQRKARRLSIPDAEVNWKVRNLDGGFVFVRSGFTTPSAVEQVACDCLRETGLDFGAVDVIWNQQQEKAYVLEVNTAPGLEGQTVDDYAAFFSS